MTSTSRPASSARATSPVLDRLVEELTNQIQAGASIDLEAYARQYPEYAESIRQLLPALEVLADLGRSAARGAAPAHSAGLKPAAELGELGDYRILREVGRGGMGVVYEARQLSLGRRVALKVLPFAAALDPRQLQRFKVEAQAAALLHHTHIVPVFAVGVERGVHYYAMQFIEGRTLSEVIRELRRLNGLLPKDEEPGASDRSTVELAAGLASGQLTPAGPRPDASPPPPAPQPAATDSTSGPLVLSSGSSITGRAFFQAAARLGIQAAEALEYAHSLGVVHRDIKPANLLLDTRGKLWVTDFGLAQVQAEAGLTLTLTGDVLGTLRYMSPEQALGRRALVDHRSDIYSLGVTLYELLTLRPAVGGSDRQEILRRIAFEETPGLRRLNPAVPRELETIVLKAMAKEPEGRYATAQELADDLTRFLEHRPIQARRPSVAERAAKWARRHIAVVASVLMLLVISVIGFGLATLLIWREQARTHRAYQAEAQLRRKTRQAVDEMYGQVAQQLLVEKPDMEKVRRDFLEKALAYYRDFAVRPEADAVARHEAAKALLRVGDIERQLGHYPEAESAYRQAVPLLDDLAGHHPEEPSYRENLVTCYERLGFTLSDTGRLGEGERSYRQGLALAERLAADFPQELRYQRLVATLCINLGTLLHKSGRLQELEVLERRARDLMARLAETHPHDARARADLALANGNLAGTHIEMGRREEAERELRAAIQFSLERSAEHPDSRQYRHSLAKKYMGLSELLLALGGLQEAEESSRKALALEEELVKEFPNIFWYSEAVGSAEEILGRILKAAGRLGEAEQTFRRSLAIAEKMVADMPSRTDGLPELAWVQGDLGECLWETGRASESRTFFQRARETWEKMIVMSPDSAVSRCVFALLLADCPDPQLRDLARAVKLAREAVDRSPHMVGAWEVLGVALYRAGAANEAIQPLRQSVEMTTGGGVSTWFFLAMALARAGDKHQARQWYDRATGWVEKHSPKDPGMLHLRAEAAALIGNADAPGPAQQERRPSK
jgi:serine/threonine protein kinase/tetratricopeptide (TPR) repeat protein